MQISRRMLLKSAATLGGLALAGRSVPALVPDHFQNRAPAPLPPVAPAAEPAPFVPDGVSRDLMGRALAALDRHDARIARRDRIAIVDFSARSSDRRLHMVDLVNGRTQSLLVSHGRGSDPGHTGWLKSFSNAPGSNASSQGAYLTSNYYTGQHGHSQRLIGLDPTNDNAMDRAIVIHSAWYAEAEMLRTHGMLGRSEGCFAVGENDLAGLFAQLGEGRLLYADKV